MTNFNLIKILLNFPYFPESSSILVITGSGINLSPEVINLEGKTCSRLPEKLPENTYGSTGGFINGQVIICGGTDREFNAFNECYTLKNGRTWTLLGNLSEKRDYSLTIHFM